MGDAEYGCSVCGSKRKPRRIPYGSKRKLVWCRGCDRDMAIPMNKKSERQKSKRISNSAKKRSEVGST